MPGKKLFSLLVLLLALQPGLCLSSARVRDDIQSYVGRYNGGGISAPQLVFYLETIRCPAEDSGRDAYEAFETDDFTVEVYGCFPESGNSYGVGYELEPRYEEPFGPHMIEEFKDKLEAEVRKSRPDFSNLRRDYRELGDRIWNLDSGECLDLMRDTFPEEEDQPGGTVFTEHIIEEEDGIRVTVRAFCHEEEGGWLGVESWGGKYDPKLQEFHDMEPGMEHLIEKHVNLREAFQDSFDNDFIGWYVDRSLEVMRENPELMDSFSPEDAFRRIVQILINNEAEISNTLAASGMSSWPAGFEEIDIDYTDGNIEFHVWERMVPRQTGSGEVDTWSTFYAYRFMPDREILKGALEYKLGSQSFAPPPGELEKVRDDEDAMEVIGFLSDKFGGSLDFRVNLNDDGERMFSRFVTLNPDQLLDIGETRAGRDKLDFTITVDFDALYNLMESMSSFDLKQTRGPHWADIESYEPSPFKVIGTVVGFWRGGVSIRPVGATFKIVMSAKDLLFFIQEMESAGQQAPDYSRDYDLPSGGTGTGETGEPEETGPATGTTDQIEFRVEMSYQGQSMNLHYKARNLQSGAPDIWRSTPDGRETIALGSEQKGWMKLESGGAWTESSQLYPWVTFWDSVYDKQFKGYYSAIEDFEGTEYESSGAEGGVRIYGIDRSPDFPDSVFEPSG